VSTEETPCYPTRQTKGL